jgi:chitodextrinase
MTPSLIQDLYQGRHEGSAVAWQAGATMVTIAGLLSDADALDAAKACTFGLDVSFDGGQTYGLAARAGWAGGTNPRTNGPNIPIVTVGYSASGQAPTHVRPFVDCPQVLSIGVAAPAFGVEG